nr:hypothetical protein [Variovorax paradoxus]
MTASYLTLITGASRGLGRAMTEQLAQACRSSATAAAKVLKQLARGDFGNDPVADVRDPA